MIRRSFLASLAALGAAAPLRAAPGFGDRGPWTTLPERARVVLWHGGRLQRPATLVLWGRDGGSDWGLRLSLRDALPQFDENRLDLNAGPLVRPTIGRRLQGATQVGPIRLTGDTLIAATGDSPRDLPAVIAWRRQSWDVPRSLIAGGTPVPGQPGLGPADATIVGAAYATPTGLVLALTPTIIDAPAG